MYFPVIILVEPQLAVNVGLIARVMLNFQFTELRLVNPRDKDILENCLNISAGADTILKNTKIFTHLSDAVEDLSLVYALSKRSRTLNKPTLSLFEAFPRENNHIFNLYKEEASYKKIGYLFGKESSGLSNKDLNYAHALISIPTNNGFDSLNISQAVGLLCYEWFKYYTQQSNILSSGHMNNNANIKNKVNKYSENYKAYMATFKDLEYLFSYLEGRLGNKAYLKDKKYSIMEKIRNIFLRSNLTRSEVQVLYTLIKNL